MLTPNTGKVVTNMGNKAQCMAQVTEVAIPTASQFSFTFISGKGIKIAIMLQILFLGN